MLLVPTISVPKDVVLAIATASVLWTTFVTPQQDSVNAELIHTDENVTSAELVFGGSPTAKDATVTDTQTHAKRKPVFVLTAEITQWATIVSSVLTASMETPELTLTFLADRAHVLVQLVPIIPMLKDVLWTLLQRVLFANARRDTLATDATFVPTITSATPRFQEELADLAIAVEKSIYLCQETVIRILDSV